MAGGGVAGGARGGDGAGLWHRLPGGAAPRQPVPRGVPDGPPGALAELPATLPLQGAGASPRPALRPLWDELRVCAHVRVLLGRPQMNELRICNAHTCTHGFAACVVVGVLLRHRDDEGINSVCFCACVPWQQVLWRLAALPRQYVLGTRCLNVH